MKSFILCTLVAIALIAITSTTAAHVSAEENLVSEVIQRNWDSLQMRMEKRIDKPIDDKSIKSKIPSNFKCDHDHVVSPWIEKVFKTVHDNAKHHNLSNVVDVDVMEKIKRQSPSPTPQPSGSPSPSPSPSPSASPSPSPSPSPSASPSPSPSPSGSPSPSPSPSGSPSPSPSPFPSPSPSPAPTRPSNREPIRFRLVSLLGNDPYACNQAGRSVIIGDDNTTRAACEVNDNCLYQCNRTDVPTTQLLQALNASINTVLDIYKEFLTIDPVQGNLRLNEDIYEATKGQCFYGVPIDRRFVDVGVPNTDFLVYVTARPCSSSGTVAYAASCSWEYDRATDTLGRPTAAIVNFCVKHFDGLSDGQYTQFDFMSATKVALHEFTHALGFSSNLYKSYNNPQTNKPYDCVTVEEFKNGTSPAGESYQTKVSAIQLPHVVELARNHYDCPSLPYVYLEEAGGAGTAGSHWEQRIVQTELMAGFINPLMPLSRLTLSLFEDMGWYTVTDFTRAEPWLWGKDEGCPFVLDRCEKSWRNRTGYWCESSSQTACTPDYMAKGECNVVTYQNDLPAYWQHFDNPRRGGSSASSDACPFIAAESSTDNVFCADTSRSMSEPFEYFGSLSRCWSYSATSQSVARLACWNHSCENGDLRVGINNQWFTCPRSGGALLIERNGVHTVNCPPASLLCRVEIVPRGALTFDTCASVDESLFDAGPWESWMIGLIIIGGILLCCVGLCWLAYKRNRKAAPARR